MTDRLHLRLTFDGKLLDPLLDDKQLRRILGILNPPGEETRLVGGAVRNALLGRPPGDIDLATTMRPEAVMALAKAARLRSIPTGIAHGTVTLIAGGVPFEVTTLREDVETDGRHAVVRFGRDFAADALRRDFTMNALSAGPDGHVFDTVGGIADLAAGRVRFIGDAATRIREDYLRILRFFRFHAAYGSGQPDPEGLEATKSNREGLARLSRERVRTEIFKILTTPGVCDAMQAMDEVGILGAVLGRPGHLDRLARITRTDAALPDPLLRLAALAVENRDDADGLREALRLSNAELARLYAAVDGLQDLKDRTTPPDSRDLRRLLFDHGRQAAADILWLAFAAGGEPSEIESWRAAATLLADMPAPTLPFSGADLMARGLRGRAVGRGLAALRAAWADADFPEDRTALDGLIERTITLVEAQGDQKSA